MTQLNSIYNKAGLTMLGFENFHDLHFVLKIDNITSVRVYMNGPISIVNYDTSDFLSSIKSISQLEALVKLLRGEEIL